MMKKLITLLFLFVSTSAWAQNATPGIQKLSAYHLVSAATTNATNVKATPGLLCGWKIRNRSAGDRKVAFHDTSSTPTAGANIYFTIDLSAGAAANVLSTACIGFSTGIAFTTVTGAADTDNTAVSLNDLQINLFYR